MLRNGGDRVRFKQDARKGSVESPYIKVKLGIGKCFGASLGRNAFEERMPRETDDVDFTRRYVATILQSV